MEVCRFFARGQCAYGSACRFPHVLPNANGTSTGQGTSSKPSAQNPEEHQLELEEERVDPYDDECCTFLQLREKYFGVYCEADIRKYWREDMKQTGTFRPTLRRAAGDEGTRQICRHFLSGSCSFGDACRNLHVLDVDQLDGDSTQPARTVRAGARTDPEPRARTAPFGDSADEEAEFRDCSLGLQQRAPGFNGMDKKDGKVIPLEDTECGICFDSIEKKGEQFGMLENCDHAFCLSCIRSWRKQKEMQDRKNLRMCPLCRNESFFLIPCDRLILNPSEKAMAIASYKRQMSVVPCRAFDYGRGKCPLGTSCFYAHLNPDGTQFTAPRPRKMVGASGTHRVQDVILSDFL